MVDNRDEGEYGDFFNSENWLSILKKGLGANFLEFDVSMSKKCWAPVFKKGPFRVLYPGFPIGDFPPKLLVTLTTESNINTAGNPWELLRLWQSSSVIQFAIEMEPVNYLPETVIADLQAWDLSKLSSSVRRNIKKAGKSGLRVRCAKTSDCGNIFSLYRNMIKSHGGAMRYSFSYFEQMINCSVLDSRIHVNVAHTVDGSIASMLVWVSHREVGYYLHGATDSMLQNKRPADLLMYKAIRSAKESGLRSFSFLPSPSDQPGLIRFKEKWGGRTLQTPVYDCFQHSFRAEMLRMALGLSTRLSR